MRMPRAGSLVLRAAAVLTLALAAGPGCQVFDRSPQPIRSPQLPGQSQGTFTTARPTFLAAVDDFLGRRPEPVQPLEFPHDIHAGKQIACTEYCHEGASTQAVAGLPGIRTCMICHNAIARNRPRIQRITAMREQGFDLAWQRVFDYPAPSHVRFNHAPHIRAGVACDTCHGDIARQTVARRNVELTMGVCVTCHNERKAPIDCLTCHN
jgi:Cytochrome c7 and related cytochrome c